MIDGATRFQTFASIVLPMVRGGIAATAVLCFIFSWTEFLLSLFLTTSIRTVPVKITTFVTSTGYGMGLHLRARHIGHHSELHLHPARPKTSGARPDPRFAEGVRRGTSHQCVKPQREECHELQESLIVRRLSSTRCSDLSRRQITKRDFLRKMALAGVGLSAFARRHARRPAAAPRPARFRCRGGQRARR